MFYGLVVASAVMLCFGFGNYIIKNKWLKGMVLCLGWILMVLPKQRYNGWPVYVLLPQSVTISLLCLSKWFALSFCSVDFPNEVV